MTTTWKKSTDGGALGMRTAEAGPLRLQVIGQTWRVVLPGSRPIVLAQGRSEGVTPDPHHDARQAALALAEEIVRACT